MIKLKVVTVLFLSLLFAFPLSAKNQSSNAEQSLKLSIANQQHVLHLQENTDLMQRIKSSSELSKSQVLAKHYSGHLSGQNQSWYRLSNVNGHWSGVVSIDKQIHIIDAEIEQATVSAGFPLSLIATKLSESHTDEPYQCGTHSAQHATHAVSKNIHERLTNKTTNKLALPASSAANILLDKPLTAQKMNANLCTDLSDGVCLLAEVEFVFDQLFQDAYPSAAEAQAEAVALINVIEGYYFNDFEIKFDTLVMEFLTSEVFAATTDAGDLLDDVRTKKRTGSLDFVTNSRALLHLVTGRDFDGSTAGIAFVGVLCNSRGASSGTSQLLRRRGSPSTAITALVIAHELGHNFGSSHDGDGNTCGGGFVMAPSVSSSATGFSTCSIDSMTADINALASSSFTNTSECFNFPTDISISANAANTSDVIVGQSIVTDYAVSIDDSSFEQLASLNVDGDLPTGSGSFENVSINSTTCTIANSGESYTCDLSDLTAPINLNITTIVGSTSYQQTHTVSVGGSSDIVDINQSNDSVVSSFAVTEVPPPSAASNTQATIDTSGTADVVDLSWTDNSNSEDGFRIERSEGSAAFENLSDVSSNVTTFTDTTVSPGGTYTYRVTAFNAGGISSASNTSSVTLGIAPNAVSNTTATINANGAVDIAWEDNSDNEAEFIIQRSVSSGTFVELDRVAADTLTFSDSSVSASTTYAYRVIASNATGQSAASNEVSVTTAATPVTPPASGDSGGGSLNYYLLIFLFALILIKTARRNAHINQYAEKKFYA